MKFKKTAWVMIIAMLFSLLSYSGGTTAWATGFKVKNVTDNKKTMYVGSVYQIKTNAASVTYTSKNKKVATVSSTGLVTAKKKGKATIVVKNSRTGKKIKLKILVKKPTAYKINKKSGTYTGTVKVKLKARKGYVIYYTTGKKFKASKKIKSGKSKKITISKSKTLKIYFVKKKSKTSIQKINKTRNKSDHCVSYKYMIQVKQNSTPSDATNSSTSNSNSNTIGNTTTNIAPTDVSNVNEATWSDEEKNGADISEAWEELEPVYVSLDDEGSSAVTSDGSTVGSSIVKISGSEITIKETGTYVLSGTLSDGNILIKSNANNSTIILNGVDITSSTTAAIYANKNAANLTITLAQGSINRLTGPETYVFEEGEDEPDAVLFAKKDLLLNGSGTLYVTSPGGDAVKCKAALKIADGNYIINSADEGITGKDLIAVCGGTINIISEGDGMKTNLQTDPNLGYIDISGGEITITSQGDGIQADTTIKIENAVFNIVTDVVSGTTNDSFKGIKAGGEITYTDEESGASVTETLGLIYIKSGDFAINTAEDGIHSKKDIVIEGGTFIINTYSDGIQAANNINILGGDFTITTAKKSSYSFTSFKGIKAGTNAEDNEGDATGILLITDGTINIDTTKAGTTSGNTKGDDALHSNAALQIDGGTIELSAGDDAIHSDTELTINGGTIVINTCYEGVESSLININGGSTRILNASDDGVNVCGGTDGSGGDSFNPGFNFGFGQNSQTSASTGETDTTKLLHITGGYLFVNANGDGLDSNGSIYMEGGTAIVYGPTDGGNGALDYDGSFTITGGYLFAAGASGMVQTPSAGTQGYISSTSGKSANTSVCLKNSSGKYLVAAIPTKSYGSVIISCPEITSGSSYSLVYGGTISGTKNADNYYNAISAVSGGTTSTVNGIVGSSSSTSGPGNMGRW